MFDDRVLISDGQFYPKPTHGWPIISLAGYNCWFRSQLVKTELEPSLIFEARNQTQIQFWNRIGN